MKEQKYGYMPGTIIFAGVFRNPEALNWRWGKDIYLEPMNCRLCEDLHLPVIEEDTITILRERKIVLSAGECKELPSFEEESVVTKERKTV